MCVACLLSAFLNHEELWNMSIGVSWPEAKAFNTEFPKLSVFLYIHFMSNSTEVRNVVASKLVV